MSNVDWIWTKPPQRRVRAIVVAIVGPGVVTLLAGLEQQLSTSTAALLYVLVVAVSAGFGGAMAGVAASLLSFLALNFFFTPPLHTFAVGKLEDLVALMVFLLVSVITGLLLSSAVREKSRAETREAQTRLLNQLTNRLLSGVSLEDVLEQFAQSVLRLLDLASCEIQTQGAQPLIVTASTSRPTGEPFHVDLVAKGQSTGSLRVTPPADRRKLDHDEQNVVENVAGQLSLALESLRLTDEVRRAQVEAETSQMRAALFSGVTHDLKTPLAAITASVTSLLEGPRFTEDELHDHLDTIKQEAERLNRVVTNLMDLARVRAGALVPARVSAAIDELIEAVVARLQSSLQGREVQLNLRGDLPEMSIDIVQIDQALTNLIENAVKFTPPGSPIYITAVGGDRQVRVTVADKGIGIPAHDRERIFQPFERGRGEVAGTGLGLAIARAVVTAHGGRIWAQDGPGGGAAVTFELPLGRDGNDA